MKTCRRLLYLASLLLSGNTYAQWDGNPATVNNPIAPSASWLVSESVITDNYGGAIIAWKVNKAIYLQRRTVGGLLHWNNANPLLLYNGAAASTVKLTDMIPDGNGGAYISWTDYTSAATSDLFLQHIASNGEKIFGNTGIKVNPGNRPVCTEGKLCLSSSGINIVWANQKNEDQNARTDSSLLFLQKYDLSGQALWNIEGIPVSTGPGYKFWPAIASDSAGGVYISFTDTRNSISSDGGYHDHYDVYLQRFDNNGTRLWGSNDVAINDALISEVSLSDYSPPFVNQRKGLFTDATGSIIVFYNVYNPQGFPQTSYAQKMNASGAALWGTGVNVLPNNPSKIFFQIASDGNNGIVICWKNVGQNQVYAQRISATGIFPWGNSGILVNPSTDIDWNLTGISMVNDEEGNYVVSWKLDTTVNGQPSNFIKAQKFNNAGTLLWPTQGLFICSVANVNSAYPALLKSINNSTFFTWGGSRGIYAALVDADGTLKNIPSILFTTVASGNWDDPSIWAGIVVPPPGANIVITQNITVNVNIICNSIIVQPPYILTVNPGVQVTILQ